MCHFLGTSSRRNVSGLLIPPCVEAVGALILEHGWRAASKRAGWAAKEQSYERSYDHSQAADRGDHRWRTTAPVVDRGEARDRRGEPSTGRPAERGDAQPWYQFRSALRLASAADAPCR